MNFSPKIDNDLLFAEATFAKMAREYGKSTKEVRQAVRQSTTLFIHYIIDYSAQKHQGDDEEREVAIKPLDIIKAIQELGFDSISRKLKNQK